MWQNDGDNASSRPVCDSGMRRADRPSRDRCLLLLTPSTGFGGGIERVADAIEDGWPGPVVRVNLYRPDEVARPAGNLRAKARFSRRAVAAAARQHPAALLLLHVNFIPVGLFIWAVTGARVGMFAHGVEVWSPMSRWTRLLIDKCDWILANSSYTATWFARRAGIELNRVRVVPLPIDPSLAEAAAVASPPRPGPADGHVRLLTVSRLVPEDRFKGCFTVARALPAVLARQPSIRWTLVGDGADLPVIREECRALGIDHAVELTGRISDNALAQQYRRADLFVLPSSADPEASPPVGEGFGLVYAEAGAFGLPLVGSSAGGGGLEIVIDDQTGVTVPPDDPKALSEAILRLAGDAELRARLGRGAMELVETRHLPSVFAAALRSACDTGTGSSR
jgi:glycosyltransferase involved in cell wall biosynthesis